jgi:hypothetical protein
MTARRAWRLRLTIEPSVVREIPRFVPVVVGGEQAFWRSARLLRVKPGLPPWGQCPLPPSAISARCRLPRQDFTRGEACRFAYRAADQVRVGDQPQHGKDARPRNSAHLARRPSGRSPGSSVRATTGVVPRARIATPFQRLTSQFGFGPGPAQMSKTATFFVMLLGAFAVAAVFQLKHLMRVPETLYAEVAEVIGPWARVVRHRMGPRWHRLPGVRAQASA